MADIPKRGRGRPKGATDGTRLAREVKTLQRQVRTAATIDPPAKVDTSAAADTGREVPPGRQPNGVRLRPEHQEEVRAKIQASVLVDRLHRHAIGTLDLSPTQIKAAEILLSKSISTLASTELTMINNNDKLSEREIMDKIGELIARDPRLLQVLQSRVSSGAGGVVVDVEPVAPTRPLDIVPDAPCVLCGGEGMPGGCIGCGADPADDTGGPIG